MLARKGVPTSRPIKRKIESSSSNCYGSHPPESQQTRKRCSFYTSNGKENRIYVACMTCEVPLFLVKDRNCFHLHHSCLQTLQDHFRLCACCVKSLYAIVYS